jgi:hypothetical protein
MDGMLWALQEMARRLTRHLDDELRHALGCVILFFFAICWTCVLLPQLSLLFSFDNLLVKLVLMLMVYL